MCNWKVIFMSAEFINYIQDFMNRIELPTEAKDEFIRVEKIILSNKVISGIFVKNKYLMMNELIGYNEAMDAIGRLGESLGIPAYTLHFVFLLNCTDILFENYRKKHLDEQLFWDTMRDLRHKLIECHEVKGVWGTFVAHWFEGFFKMKRFTLGRFQYEEAVFKCDTYKKNGIVLSEGDKVYSFHIPASGEKFDRRARIESYRKAYDFYGCKDKGGLLYLICISWLMHKELRNILPPTSNILDFMNDFDIISSEDHEVFKDGWRVFGKYHNLPPEQLPKDTSLRKAIAEHLASGGKLGTGYGVIVFDGDKIIN